MSFNARIAETNVPQATGRVNELAYLGTAVCVRLSPQPCWSVGVSASNHASSYHNTHTYIPCLVWQVCNHTDSRMIAISWAKTQHPS
jgi:hypothetical protein